MAKWKKDREKHVVRVLGELNKCRYKIADGEFSYHGGLTKHVVLINSLLELNEDVPFFEKQKMIFQVLNHRKRSLSADDLLSKIEILEKTYTNKTPVKYFLCASLSLDNKIGVVKNRIINDVDIRFYDVFSPKLQKSVTQEWEELKKGNYVCPTKESESNRAQYVKIKAFVKGRSAEEAVNKAFNSIALLRGIWNLTINVNWPEPRSYSIINPEAKKKPVNLIQLAPLLTLHSANGDIVRGDYSVWNNECYHQTDTLSNLGDATEKVYKEEIKIRKKVNQLPDKYKERI
ncbi:hypothetical protein ACFL2A_04750, partial [Thermodesulfobacteriota bacterium]